jgi:hypothetical protein
MSKITGERLRLYLTGNERAKQRRETKFLLNCIFSLILILGIKLFLELRDLSFFVVEKYFE